MSFKELSKEQNESFHEFVINLQDIDESAFESKIFLSDLIDNVDNEISRYPQTDYHQLEPPDLGERLACPKSDCSQKVDFDNPNAHHECELIEIDNQIDCQQDNFAPKTMSESLIGNILEGELEDLSCQKLQLLKEIAGEDDFELFKDKFEKDQSSKLNANEEGLKEGFKEDEDYADPLDSLSLDELKKIMPPYFCKTLRQKKKLFKSINQKYFTIMRESPQIVKVRQDDKQKLRFKTKKNKTKIFSKEERILIN